MTAVAPRVIRGNRGDLVSRYGILSALIELGVTDITVSVNKPADIIALPYSTVPYGQIYNLVPSWEGWQALRKSDYVLWLAGLDLQDDSSLLKLLHTFFLFLSYRLIGKRIVVLAQGAGPLTTTWGRTLSRWILALVDEFLVRDSGSFELLRGINPEANLTQGADGIFLGTFDLEAAPVSEELAVIGEILGDRKTEQTLIGFNIRQWFHFSSSLLPYQFVRQRYEARSAEYMDQLVHAAAAFIKAIREKVGARILLLSAYEPNVEPWEDDLPWLEMIKQHFPEDSEVVLVDQPLSLLSYCKLVSELDLMIGTRLHSTLTALRFGIPAININYTLKGKDIYQDLGLADRVITLEQFMKDPLTLVEMAVTVLNNLAQEKQRVRLITDQAIENNMAVLQNTQALKNLCRLVV